MYQIGLDVGNGSIVTAIASENQQGLKVRSYISAYGVAKEGEYYGRKQENFPIIHYQNQQYVLGYDAIRKTGAEVLDAYDRTKRYEHHGFQLLTRLALIDAAVSIRSGGFFETNLALGVPSEEYKKDIIRTLKNWFTEPVIADRDGVPVTIKVNKVEVLSQPIAVMMDAYLDDAGYVNNGALEEAHLLVIDGGSGTLDLAEFKNMRVIKQASEAIGINDVYQMIIDEIRIKEPKFRIDPVELEYQLRLYDKSPAKIVKHGAKELDVTTIYRNAMDTAWTKMQRAIIRHYPDQDDFEAILVAGGVAGGAFAGRFKEWNPSVTIIDDPQSAVAKGLCKYLLAGV